MVFPRCSLLLSLLSPLPESDGVAIIGGFIVRTRSDSTSLLQLTNRQHKERLFATTKFVLASIPAMSSPGKKKIPHKGEWLDSTDHFSKRQ